MSSLSNTREKLQSELAHLTRQWQTTASLWNDSVRHRFERDFMQEYERIIHPALNQMDRLAAVIAQARREVK